MNICMRLLITIHFGVSTTIHRPLTKQRKTAASFRDNTLLDCFKTAIRLLRTGLETNSFNVSDPKQVQLIDGLLRLAMACLNYDFIGTCQDESADDQV